MSSIIAKSCNKMIIGKNNYRKNVASSSLFHFNRTELGKLHRIEDKAQRMNVGGPGITSVSVLERENVVRKLCSITQRKFVNRENI